ncbi:MAG: flavoprotein oxidoreductase, partial [Bacteroidota bacterium]
PQVWAAGDCATSWHILKNRQVFNPLGTVANKHSLVAGINISGGDAVFPGVLGTAIIRFKELEIARSGLSEKEAQEEGIPVVANTIESTALSSYFPGSEEIAVKLIAEKGSLRIIGGQIVGKKASGKRIDTIAMAIMTGMTAPQLVNTDLSYAPPFSPVWDPVQTAARTLL